MDGGGDGEYGEHGEWERQDESRTVHAAHEPTSGRRQSISDGHQSTSDGRYTRVISREQSEESVEFRCQRVLYQAFVSEMMEIVAPLGASLDATRLGSTFCLNCDSRASSYLSRPVENDALLERQLRFEPVHGPKGGEIMSGHWTIHRFWRAGFSHFPSCEGLARETAQKLIDKLSAFGNGGTSYSAREVTYKVQKSFIRMRVRWAEEEDLSGKVTFLPQLAHVNEASDSSPIRLVVVPNREVFVNKQLGTRSYNSFVRKNTVELPRFTKLSLVTALSRNSLFVDIEDCYGCLRNSVEDARQAVVFCLKTKNGLPSYDLNQCPDGTLFALLQASSSFGQADVSRLSQMALSRMATVYRQHRGVEGVGELELQDIETVLKLFSYADDSQVPALTHRVLRWCESQGRPPPRPPCLCPASCESWDCTSLSFTSEDIAMFDTFMKKETESYLVCLAAGFVKVANFSQHFVKFVSGTSARMQAKLDEAGVTAHQSAPSLDLKSDVIRPTPEQVRSEVGGQGPVEKMESGGLAGQLGKTYTDTQVFLKTQRIYICHYVGKSKRKTPAFGDYDSIWQHCVSKGVKISKISISSLVGSFWDPAGVHLCQVRAYVKEAARIHLRNGPVTWQEPVSTQVEKIFWKSIEAYFLICGLPHPRCNLLAHPSAQLALLGGSDGAEHLQSLVVTGLSHMVVDKKYVCRAQHLHLANYANNTRIVQDMPLVELVAFHKLLVVFTQVLVDLRSLGVHIPPSACYLTIDSKTALIQVRTRAHLYQKRVAGLITRIQLLLAQFDLCPFSQVFWIDQKSLPSDGGGGGRYHPDIISKTKQERATREGILRDFSDLHSMAHLEGLPVKQWSWLHRDVALPRMADQDLIQDLKVDEDHLEQLREFLEKPTIASRAAFTRGVSTMITVPRPNRCHGGADDGAGAGEGGDAIGEDAEGVPPAPSILSVLPVDLPNPQSGLASRADWREILSHLMSRKRMYGLGARSAISVLAWVFRYIANLRRRCALRRASLAPVLTTDKCHWPKHAKPWCGKVLCGLQGSNGCRHPHPRLIPADSWDEDPVGQWAPTKGNPHFLFQRQSLVGFNLGHPETLESAIKKLGDWVIGRKAAICHSEWRIIAFDYLCFLFQDCFEVRGYTVMKTESEWGECSMAVGRKQRDWEAGEDTLPRFRQLDKSSKLGELCIATAHAASLGESTELAKLYLVSLRVILPSERKMLKAFQRECCACNLSVALCQRSDTKLRSNHLGPSGRLSAIGLYPPGLTCCQIDLIGPLVFSNIAAQEVKLYPLISVSHTWGQTRLIPIRSKDPHSVLLGLKTLSLQSSVCFQLMAADSGGEFTSKSGPGGNAYSPMEDEGSEDALAQGWFGEFVRSVDELQLQGLGLHVRLGKGRNCSAAERRVGDVKSIWKSFHLFLRGSEPTDLFEIHFLCALTEHIIHSRPVLVHDGKIYSLNTLLCLMTNEGYLAASDDGLGLLSESAARKNKVQKVCFRLSQLRTQLTRLIMATQLDTLLDNIHRREHIKHKLSVMDLKIGDVVFDSLGFVQTGHLSGSLARVVALGKSRNHLLISKAMLKSRGATFKQVCVSRPSNELHFICHGTGHPVAIGEMQTFNILKYIPQMEGAPPLWTLPGQQPCASNSSSKFIDLSEAGTSGNIEASAGQQCETDGLRSDVGVDDPDTVPALIKSSSKSRTDRSKAAGQVGDSGAVEPSLAPLLTKTNFSKSEGADRNQGATAGPPEVRTRRGRLVRKPKRLDL